MYSMIRRILLVVVCLALATAASAQQLGYCGGRGPGCFRRRSARCHGRSRQPGADREGAHGNHRWLGPVPDRQPAAGRLHRHLHAHGIQRRPPRGRRSVRRRDRPGERGDEGRRRGRNHHRHGRSARRRPSVGRADALGHGAGVQRTALGRIVDPDGRARAGRPGVEHATWAASSAIRPAPRSPRTATAPGTACRWSTACASATCTSART